MAVVCKLQLDGRNVVPSWDRRGGCASRKNREATFESADGVSGGHSGVTTPSAPSNGLMARPPLLSQEGTTQFGSRQSPYFIGTNFWNRVLGGPTSVVYRFPLESRPMRSTKSNWPA